MIELELIPVYSLKRTRNTRKVRKLYNLAFPVRTWMGRAQVHWMLSTVLEPTLGFCSSLYLKNLKCVCLTAAWVKRDVRGGGIQRRMIRTRVKWAKKQGAQFCVSYCSAANYASLYSLMRCGFKVYWKDGWHMCVLKFTEVPQERVDAAFKAYDGRDGAT